jgi:quinol monooxygenase YgiN
MHLYIFTTFHARDGCGADVERALMKVVRASRGETGCLAIHAFRSIRNDRLFYIHSQWQDEAAFDRHAELAHTVRFIDEVTPLIDHPVQAIRTQRLD